MKKILVLGTGAQGSAAARKLDKEPSVGEIICADYDEKAVNALVGELKKARGIRVDASDKQSIIEAAKGVDLILNGLPLPFAENVLDAALEVRADYQDYAGSSNMADLWRNSKEAKEAPPSPDFDAEDTAEWYDSYRALFEIYGPRFKEINRLAVFGTGSAPGLICLAARHAMKFLDSCESIYHFVWEGVVAKRFLPFWWSPVTALSDMSETAVAFENGRLVNVPSFGRPVKRKYDYMDTEIEFREHCHDEPMQYCFHADEFFKGCKNVYFKYAGAGMDFCRPLAAAGLLNRDKENISGVEIAPFDVILAHIPPAPKYREEIKEIIDEGLVSDSGCLTVEAYGKKDGKDICVEVHVMAPGLIDSFEKEGITAEMYLTGQSGYLYSKLFLDDMFDQKGLISSDMLTYEQVDRYFEYAAELDIHLETLIREL